MNRSLALGVSLILLTATLQTAGAQKAESGDLAKLQGKWTSFTSTPRGAIRSVVEIKGNLISTTVGDGPSTKPDSVAEIVLDETRSPKRMSLRNARFVDVEPGSLKEKLRIPDIEAVYELDGDTWKTCTNILSKNLPTKVASGKGLSLAVYKRGELDMPAGAAGKAGRGGKATTDPNTRILKGVKVTNPQRVTATLVTTDGESIEVTTNHAKEAYEQDGKKATQLSYFYHEGNVLDVILVAVPGKKPGWEIREVHMISGEFKSPARTGTRKAMASKEAASSAQPAATTPKKPKNLRPEQILKRATVGKTFKDHYQLFIDGVEFNVYTDNPHATSFDLAGKQLPRQSASKLLREGNLVDVGFFLKHPAHPFYMISEIHLIEGQLQ